MDPLSHPQLQPPRLPKRLPAGTFQIVENQTEYFQLLITDQDLHNFEGSGLLLEQVHCRRVLFTQTRFSKLRVLDTRFEKCEFSGADWEKARFRRVEFSECRLSGIKLVEASFEDATFKECKGEGAIFISATFKEPRFEKCNFQEGSFEGADLSGAIFKECNLSRADLRGTKLIGADFRGSIINGIQIGIKEFQGAIIDPSQALQIIALSGIIVKEIDEEL